MKSKKIYDAVVVGAGPAGITSAIYLARSGVNVALVERGIYGGQLNDTDEIENYTAFENISGTGLAKKMEEHSKSMDGIEHLYGDVKDVTKNEKGNIVIDLGEESIYSKSLVIATGVSHKKLGVEKEDELQGRGISYCATCDGAFFNGRDVSVIGGGDSAMESAIYLSNIANSVTVIHRRNKFRAEKILQDRAKAIDNINYIYDADTLGFDDENGIVSCIRYKDKNTYEVITHPTNGVFVNVGVVPNTDAFNNLGILRESGFIYTDKGMKTSVEGIFAVGDVRFDSIRQITSAVGDGAVCSNSVNNYLKNI